VASALRLNESYDKSATGSTRPLSPYDRTRGTTS